MDQEVGYRVPHHGEKLRYFIDVEMLLRLVFKFSWSLFPTVWHNVYWRHFYSVLIRVYCFCFKIFFFHELLSSANRNYC